MHKKFNKYGYKDFQNKHGSKKSHIKRIKDNNEESTFEVNKVPQNSKCELIRKCRRDLENKENVKTDHKHRRHHHHHRHHSKPEPNSSNHHHNKKRKKDKKHPKDFDINLPISLENKSDLKFKENIIKHERYDKEKLYNLKYFEILNKSNHKNLLKPHSSVSLRRSGHLLKPKEKHLRREITFHNERPKKLPMSSDRSKKIDKEHLEKRTHKKHKDGENDIQKGTQNQLYCQIQTQNPFKCDDRNKKTLANLYPSEIYKTNEQNSSEQKLNNILKDKKLLQEQHQGMGYVKKTKKQSSNQASDLVSYLTHKHKSHHKRRKELKSIANLVGEHISDKKAYRRHHDTNKLQKHRRSAEPVSKKPSPEKTDVDNKQIKYSDQEIRKKKIHSAERKTYNKGVENNANSPQDRFREKIEDDIKSYFTKLQCLIDKKLDFILRCNKSNTGFKKRNDGKVSGDDELETKNINKKRLGRDSKRTKHSHHRSKSMKKQNSPVDDQGDMKNILYSIHTNKDPSGVEKKSRHYSKHRGSHPQPCTKYKTKSTPGSSENSKSSIEISTNKNKNNRLEAVNNIKPKEKYVEKVKHSVKEKRKIYDNDTTRSYSEVLNTFRVEGIEPAKLLECTRKKSKKRIDHNLNLECKTVSIIGIPSKRKDDSNIFNHSQTRTSLNVLHPSDETLERKMKSKRFKLYYKYSLAHNVCSNSATDHSSENMSIISDSYRLLSDNSDNEDESCVDTTKYKNKMEKDKLLDESNKLRNFLYNAQCENLTKQDSKKSDNLVVPYKALKKLRLPCAEGPLLSNLKNIMEEPSSISCVAERHKLFLPIGKEVDCKYFKVMQSSSSDCNIKITDGQLLSKLNILLGRTKNCNKHAIDKEFNYRNANIKQYNEDSLQSIWPKTAVHNGKHKSGSRKGANFRQKFQSKSDINISYDLPSIIRNDPIKSSKHLLKSTESTYVAERGNILPEKDETNFSKEIHLNGSAKASTSVAKDTRIKTKEETCTKINELHKKPYKHLEENCSIQNQTSINSEISNDKKYEENIEKLSEESQDCCKNDMDKQTKCGDHKFQKIDPCITKSSPAKDAHGTKIPVYKPKSNLNKCCGLSESATANTSGTSSGHKQLIDVAVEVNSNLIPKFDMNIDSSEEKILKRADVSVETKNTNGTNGQAKLLKNAEVSVEADIFSFPTYKEDTVSPKKKIVHVQNAAKHCTNETTKQRSLMPVKYERQKRNIHKEFKTSEKKDGKKIMDPHTETENSKKTGIFCKDEGTNTIKTTTSSEFENKKCIALFPRVLKIDKKNCRARTSKSEVSFHEVRLEADESKVTSLVCLDKFNDISKLSENLQSNCQSIDYTEKSITSDLPQSSRLFLTKDYRSTYNNSFQKRKIYDEDMRKKMKKKYQSQNNSPRPQVFEVRYVTIDNLQNIQTKINPKSDCTNPSKPNSIRKSVRMSAPNYVSMPQNTAGISKTKVNSKNICKKSSKIPTYNFATKAKVNPPKVSARKPFPPVANDVDRLSKFRRKRKSDPKLKKNCTKEKIKDEIKESQILEFYKHFTDDQRSSQCMKFNYNKNLDFTDLNFIQMMDHFFKSIISTCQVDFRVSQEIKTHLTNINNNVGSYCSAEPVEQDDIKHPKDIKKNSYIVTGKLLSENVSTQSEKVVDKECADKNLINGIHTEGPTVEENRQDNVNDIASCSSSNKESPQKVVSGSCPALVMDPSSFEYFYESEPSRENIVPKFTKPTETYLGFALSNNLSVYTGTITAQHHQFNQYYKGPSSARSSGYFSTNSRRSLSGTSFFRKPNIAALFKPVMPLEVDVQSETSLDVSVNMFDYDHMRKKCQEYAHKVRIQSEAKTDLKETYEEIPLDVLLCKENFVPLSNFNSNCSICQALSKFKMDETEIEVKSIKSDAATNVDNDTYMPVLDKNQNLETSANDLPIKDRSNQSSTSSIKNIDSQPTICISYDQSNVTPVLDIFKAKKSESELLHEMLDCAVVLSSTNLNTNSLTVINPDNKKGNVRNTNSSTVIDPEGGGDYNSEFSKIIESQRENKSELKDSQTAIADEPDVVSNDIPSFDSCSVITRQYSLDYINNPTNLKKLLAKKFFENLLAVYEKEIAVTARLFLDDDFFEKDLLTSLRLLFVDQNDNVPDNKRRKKGLKSFFKKKVKEYTGKVSSQSQKKSSQTKCTAAEGNIIINAEESASLPTSFNEGHQEKLQILACNARKYFSMYVQAVKSNNNINDEMKMCGLLKLLQRIENGDFAVLRAEEEVNFEEEIREQVKQAFINICQQCIMEAKKVNRLLTMDDIQLIRTFVSKYRIALLSRTDLIAAYIGRGTLQTEKQLKDAVTYLIRLQTSDVNVGEFEEYCKVCNADNK